MKWIIIVLFFALINIDSVFAGSTTGGGWKANMVTSLDGFPSRIAGNPGIDSGTWSTPYTNATNATDGDYSTYATGSTVGDGSEGGVEAYVTWDMGSIYDISIVTVKGEVTSDVGAAITLRISQNNADWVDLPLHFIYSPTFPAISIEQTHLIKFRSRYIRIVANATRVITPLDFRIYEIKVR